VTVGMDHPINGAPSGSSGQRSTGDRDSRREVLDQGREGPRLAQGARRVKHALALLHLQGEF
jgi:hypothetical protein